MAITAAAVGGWMAANAAAIAAATTVAAAAASAYSMYSQSKAASAEAAAQTENNKKVAIAAADSYDDLSPAEIDLQRKAANLALQEQQDALQVKGRVNLFAAASGTMGGSVESSLFDVEQIKARNINTILREREAGLSSIKVQAEQTRQSAISQQTQRSVSGPSWIEGGLKIAGSLMEGYGKYTERKPTFDKQKVAGVRGGV